MQLGYRTTRALRWHPVMAAEVETLVDERGRHIEAFVSLTSFLPLRAPLPAMGGYALGADLGVEIVTHILAEKPSLVVELGSGVSTLVTAYALEQAGGGRLVSIEHNPEWVEITRERLALHGFPRSGVDVEVRHAPLLSVSGVSPATQWYDLAAIEDLRDIGLLTVDGPPNAGGDLARYPALPKLAERLADSATIVVDDAGRIPETAMIERWEAEHRGTLTIRRVPVAGGGAIGAWRRADGGK
jgi:hypothetical protein